MSEPVQITDRMVADLGYERPGHPRTPLADMMTEPPAANLPANPPSVASAGLPAPSEGGEPGLTNQGPSHTCESPSAGPPPHVLAAGRYAASFRDRDPLQARAADLPAEWRAVVQHGARNDEERARYAQHREALVVFLGLLVATEALKAGITQANGAPVPGLPPLRPMAGLDLQQAEIEVVASSLWLDDTTSRPGRFPAALNLFIEAQVQRWAAMQALQAAQQQAQGVQPQRAKLLTPADPGFASANREERRRRGVGRGH